MLSPNSTPVVAWDIFMIILICYVVISLPLDAGYGPDSVNLVDFRLLDLVVDHIFLFDVVLTFR